MTGFFNIFDAAFRLAALIAALALFAFIMTAGAMTALAANLRTDITLTKDTLTVGDIFDNAGQNADYVLGPAPQPGKEMILNVSTLMRVASAVDLSWSPQSNADQIVIRRAATIIPSAVVVDSINTALRDKVLNEKFSLDTGTMNLDVVLPQDQPGTIEVADVTYNARTARFSATIVAPSTDNPLKKFTVTGNVRPIISIPVLKNTIRNGDIIGSNDIQMTDFFITEIQPDTFLKPEDIIGLTPRRMIVAGKPVNMVDTQSPQLVERGEGVTIVFKAGPLNLTAMGKALQNGARGDQIRVVNNSSKRSIDAIVSGTHEVTVQE